MNPPTGTFIDGSQLAVVREAVIIDQENDQRVAPHGPSSTVTLPRSKKTNRAFIKLCCSICKDDFSYRIADIRFL